jgi:hypothetical protein
VYEKLKKAPCVDESGVHTINPDVYMMYEMPASVEVYRAQLCLSDAASNLHKLENYYSCPLLKICITNRKRIAMNFWKSDGKRSNIFKQN